ncbi:MAG: DUF1893 domain-containing protein [Candidatus Bathyarchaeota archaeon]|nr:DUF1893 domain-containing protein [Candidatus Bathyarchaeota archaeon]
MYDLEVAKQRLRDKKLSLVFVKNSKPIFETNKEGLSGFLQAIEELNGNLSDASVADKIIGRAASLLCAYSNVKATFAIILSQSALEILNTYNIHCEFETLVPTILNLKKTDKCPFEKLVENITNSEEAYEKIKRLYNSQTQMHTQ